MAINEELIECLTQDDVFNNSDLGSIVGYENEGRAPQKEDESNSFKRVSRLKLRVLESLWRNADSKVRRELRDKESSLSLIKKQDDKHESENSSFSAKLPLLLLIPLLESQAKSDPSLVEQTTSILFEFLRECPPLSSSKDAQQLDSLEGLLFRWCSPFSSNVASVIVALACSKRSLKTLVKTIYLLLESKGRKCKLPVGSMLKALTPYGSDVYPPIPTQILEQWRIKDYFDLSYVYDDQDDEFRRRRLTVSPSYIYLFSGNVGLVKIGNGRNGSIRGHIYATNPALKKGFLAFAQGHLIFHSANEKFQILDCNTLQEKGDLKMDSELLLEGSETLHFLSEGAQFFWIRSSPLPHQEEDEEQQEVEENEKIDYELSITLDVFDIQSDKESIKPSRERIILSRRDEGRLTSSKKSTTTSQGSSDRKNLCTSTGLDIKTLFQSPVLTCGNYVSFLTYNNTLPSHRSVFGNKVPGGGGYTAYSFSVQNGEFHGKNDFTEAISSNKQFKKKLTLCSAAATYDTFNDLIWIVYSGGMVGLLCSNFKSLAYIKNLLHIPLKAQDASDTMLVDDVRRELLRKAALLSSIPNNEKNYSSSHTNIESELIYILQDSFNEKDREGSFCILKIISKFQFSSFPLDTIINHLKEDHLLLDFAFDTFLATMKDDDDGKLSHLLNSMTLNPRLKNKIYTSLSSFKAMDSKRLLKIIRNEEFVDSLILDLIQESYNVFQSKDVELHHPRSSPLLLFLTNYISRYAFFTLNGEEDFDCKTFILHCNKIIRVIETKFLRDFLIPSKIFTYKDFDKLVKSTVIGTFFQTIISALSHPKFQILGVIKETSEEIIRLWKSISEIASAQWKNKNEGTFVGKEMGFLSTIPELDSWEPYRVIESPHPIKNIYKHEESINIPNASVIYLKFDTRCSLEPEDKFTILRWNRILVEFTKNSWPDTEYRIDWPTSITIKFETKGRNKVWGFKILVSKHISQLESTNLSLPHMTETALSVSSLLYAYMNILYAGPEISDHEEKSRPLLGLKLLGRCVWNRESRNIARIRLPKSIVTKMRDLTGIKIPPLRLSVKEALGIEDLEEGILASVMKHLSLFEVVEDLNTHERNQTLEYSTLVDMLGQTHRRINALIRRLQILADLENQWELEIDCLKDGSVSYEDIFFREYHLNETRWKELTLLGFLKGIEVNDNKRERAVNDLLRAMEREMIYGSDEDPFSRTRTVVNGIMEKIELLLKISINIEEPESSSNLMTQSLISWPDSITKKKKFLERERSLDDSILQIPLLKKNHVTSKFENKKSTEAEILDEIFEFIGSHPENAVSQRSFLNAIQTRQRRYECRNLSIIQMKEIISSAKKFEIGSWMASSFISNIKDGLNTEEIYFGANSLHEIRENFIELTSILTAISSQYYHSSTFVIETLCQIPYEKADEICLIRNGLVNLLSLLCCDQANSELAWKGFKCLANRCVSWEQSVEEEKDKKMDLVSQDEFGLARQLSIVLTNHLVRVTSSYDEKRNESLEEIISLLVFMSKCQTGKDMLSQPSCISDLLELLLEPMSPKMILEIVQLCYIGLPRMSQESVKRVDIPKWNLGFSTCEENQSEQSHLKRILNLIMAKLSDYLVPGSQVNSVFTSKPTKSLRRSSFIPHGNNSLMMENVSSSISIDRGIMALYVHKKNKNQTAHEIIQLLFNVNSEVKLFPLGGNTSNMDKVVKMDKDFTKHNKAEVICGDASLVFHKGTKLAQLGFVISVSSKTNENQDSQACRDKNIILSRSDPVRPFISSYVAHSIVTKLVSLLHSLAQSTVWKDALISLLKKNLERLQTMVKSTESLYDLDNPMELFKFYAIGRKVIAMLSIIGAFDCQLKSGDEVIIESTQDVDKIDTIDEDLGIATLCNFGEIILKRLKPMHRLDYQGKELFSQFILDELVNSFHILLTPDSEIGIDPISAALPANGDGWSLKLAVSRVLAEIRTKSCQLLALYSNDEEFILAFMRKSYQAIDMLKLVSKDVLPTDDIDLVQRKLKNLKSIYRDCFKPPIPASRPTKSSLNKKETAWNPLISFPPISSTIFSYSMTGVAYHGDPIHSTTLPRGVFIYANSNSISYFEISILSLGEVETQSESTSAVLSIGVSPLSEEKGGDDPWMNPTGSVFIHNNGRIVHYCGESPLQWKSLKLEHIFRQGDVIGLIVDERKVQFTINGALMSEVFENVGQDLFPAIHILKKGVQIKANFGNGGPFKFEEQNRKILDLRRESLRVEENVSCVKESNGDMYSFLQFDVTTKNECPGAAGHRRLSNVPSRNALRIKGEKDYDFRESSYFHPSSNAIPVFKSGGYDPQFKKPLDDDSDDDNFDDDLETRHVHEDLNSLVVKSWETKIFPIISRRFRNDSERQDGLEQIKGALSLGMTDIARQTVEFLYEESGGIPQDLHLPTIEDIKEDLSKLSIDGIKKGMIVNIGSINEELGYKIGPESIFETSFHSGEVLDVDIDNELVQVETYLKLKGILVRYWYPLCALEKSSQSNTSASSNICLINTGAFDIHNPDIHREVLNMEFALSRIYCRSAYISLLLFSTQLDLNELDFENENESVLSNIVMLQDPDIENLRLLSESFFRKSDIHSNILDTNIAIHESQSLFDISSNQFRRLFYCNEGKLINEIKRILEKDGLQSEIIHELFNCLKSPENYFITEEIEINDLSILKSLVRFDNCAFVSVSCRYEEEALSQDDLVIQLQTLNGLVLKPNGRSTPRDIIQYPADKKFPMLLLADEIVQISHGGGGEEKRPSILLHGIHRDFPLVVCVIEVLVTLSPDNFTSSTGFDLISSLLSFLTKYSAPLIIKERLFVLLLKCTKYFNVNISKLRNNLALNGLFQELRHLHALESKEKDFSSYFVVLAELLYYVYSDQECDSWFNDIKSILVKLKNWDSMDPKGEKIYPNDFDRLLILNGIHKNVSTEEIRSSILKIVDALGGTYKNSELFVPESDPENNDEGYRFAVVQVRFGSKINQIKSELEKCPLLNHQLNEDEDNETEFTITKFHSDIIHNLEANEALEKYLDHKIFQENSSPRKKLEGILTNLNSTDLKSLSESLGTDIKDINTLKNISPRVKLVKALMRIGFDLNLTNNLEGCRETYSMENHAVLVEEINDYCKDYSISPFDIHPNETYEFRYGLKALQELNKAVSKSKLLSKISFKNVENEEKVLALRSLLFTSVKTEFFNSKLIMLRNPSQPPPELSLNPVEDIGITKEDSSQTWFVQAMKHLANVDSQQLCVNFATGGDPELPLNVKMIGEEVFGNSGSFRHFLSRTTQELLSRAIPLFVPNLGSERKGLWTLKSDEVLSYNTEKYLKFFGQLIGMALRAGIPLALNLMPQNWKSLADCQLNDCDLRDFDPNTSNLISSIKNIKNQEEFEEFIEDYQFPKMTVLEVSGNERELIPGGGSIYLSWSNRNEYIEALKKFKMQEMACTERWIHIKAGLASVIPMDIFLSLFKPSEIEAIICGPNRVNIRYIKEHTIYQVGIRESDAHVRYFWSVLETLSKSQIQKFIKFCSNQDRIQTWSEENLPPYPMKIAPANGNSDEDDDPDQRYIRVETCMFMIKLPRYSSYEIMRKKIIFAISSAMDPLSG
ncbi:probable E3 ubiquitin-protein ligase HECTD4 [Lepeophtheirus salmonis]|uniref:probable E3 ubiquitin-protein ligase HECTD4 n=1 Tax=Lepeophtheirus salmonis TaxID=72036 RepID=UPI001AE7E386|nr:probable E3 ubiquitin-protein ligase HECTD4 [Lepeophtheirus salmonis]